MLTTPYAQAQADKSVKPSVTAEQKAFIDSKIGQLTGRQCGSVYDDSVTVLPPIQYNARTQKTSRPDGAFNGYYAKALDDLRQQKAAVNFKNGKSANSYWFLINSKGVTTFVYSELNQRVMRVSGCLVAAS